MQQNKKPIKFVLFDWESAATISSSSRKLTLTAENKSNLVHPIQPFFLSHPPLETV